ncbi:MAG: EamA/RhaT family transporter, partial [Alphaproteobacteria bacterium]|nr:EamA/RhaT family transporter [Alphaproteobacteria bacterium]
MVERGSGLSLTALLVGALTVGSAPIFVRLSELEPSATAFYRLLLALPVLFLWSETGVARRPRRRPRPGEAVLLVLAGLFFAGDLA